QPSKAASAASTAALASSIVALATEAMVRSVAGSTTSKRPPSDDLRHLPPIQRSVGTLARRLSYMGVLRLLRPTPRNREPVLGPGSPLARGRTGYEFKLLRTVSAMRAGVGNTASSRMSAAGSGICGVVIRTGGPSRS